jgi:hypothetical protein
MLPRPTCNTCRYWDIHREYPAQNMGYCRALPPTRSGWGATFGHDWCGQHSSSEQPVATFEKLAKKPRKPPATTS